MVRILSNLPYLTSSIITNHLKITRYMRYCIRKLYLIFPLRLAMPFFHKG